MARWVGGGQSRLRRADSGRTVAHLGWSIGLIALVPLLLAWIVVSRSQGRAVSLWEPTYRGELYLLAMVLMAEGFRELSSATSYLTLVAINRNDPDWLEKLHEAFSPYIAIARATATVPLLVALVIWSQLIREISSGSHKELTDSLVTWGGAAMFVFAAAWSAICAGIEGRAHRTLLDVFAEL